MGLLDIFDTGDTTDPPSGERGPPRTGIDIDTDLERDIARLQAMGDYEFEHFVADIWTAMGWETDVSTQSNDQGIDVIAENHFPYPECAMIQAKRYGPNTTVGSPEIQQYHSLKHQQHGVDKVIVVTTSTFTRQAIEIAEQLNVKIVDGATILHLLDDLERLDLLDEYVPLPAIERVDESEEVGPEDGWVNDPPSDVAQGDDDPDPDPVHENGESRLESIRAEVSHPTSSIVSATRVWESLDSEREPVEFLRLALAGWWAIAIGFVLGLITGSDAFLGMALLAMVIYAFCSWFAIPIAVWADRGRTPPTWHPSSLWPVGMAFPPLQGILLWLYLRRREEALSAHNANVELEREQRQRGPSIAQTSKEDPRSRSMETPEEDPRNGDDDPDADVRGYD